MPFRVFVSSTFLDLRQERETVARVLRGLQNIYIGMEFFGPHDEPPLETSLREVAGSSLYLGILAERYGTLDPATGKSITELEYRKARELSLPCAIFFRDPDFVPNDDVHRETDSEKQQKLRLLRSEMAENHTPAWFETVDDLAMQVALYLPRMMTGLYVQTRGIPPPRPPDYFVGREKEIAYLREQLTTKGLAVVAGVRGMGGIGKTALAQAYAFRHAAEFPDGIFWLPLGGRDPNIVLQDLARALDADVGKYTDLETRAGAVRTFLTGKRALMIYDDVTDTDTETLPMLRMPCATILTTRLTHLPAIDPRHMFELETLTENEALALCREILGDARVHADFDGARELCNATGYLPLALTIALRVLYNNRYETPREYAVRLHDQTCVLKELARGETKDLNVRASFDLSYATLSDEDKRRYRRLAVFASGEFGLELAAKISEDTRILDVARIQLFLKRYKRPSNRGMGYTRDTLERFADRALATRAARDRYRLHPLLLAYAGELLREARQEAVIWKRAAEIYLAFSRANSRSEGWAALEVERGNVLGILNWCHTAGEAALLAEITELHFDVWYYRGYREQSVYWLDRAVEARRRLGDKNKEAATLYYLGATLSDRGEISRALDLLQQALALAQKIGDKQVTATALHELGYIAANQGDYETARDLFEQALALKKEIDDNHGVTQTLHELGRVAFCQGDHDTAYDLCHQALALTNELGDRHSTAAILQALGKIALEQGNYDNARDLGQQALTLAKEFGDKQVTATALDELGEIAMQQRDYDTARNLFQEVLALTKELGDKYGISVALHRLGWLELELRNLTEAEARFHEGLAIAREIGIRYWIAAHEFSLAQVEIKKGNLTEAKHLAQDTLTIWEELHVPERETARKTLEEIEEMENSV